MCPILAAIQQCIKTIEQGRKGAGVYNVQWDGGDNNNRRTATGIYFIRLRSGDFTSVKKLIFVR